jgi:hypothetical protein
MERKRLANEEEGVVSSPSTTEKGVSPLPACRACRTLGLTLASHNHLKVQDGPRSVKKGSNIIHWLNLFFSKWVVSSILSFLGMILSSPILFYNFSAHISPNTCIQPNYEGPFRPSDSSGPISGLGYNDATMGGTSVSLTTTLM